MSRVPPPTHSLAIATGSIPVSRTIWYTVDMKKVLIGGVAALALSMPVAVFADNGQIIALYQQLVQILQQELTILKSQALQVSPTAGQAPLEVTVTLGLQKGVEAIDYGDGHSSGSAGCEKNAQGFCDLSKPVKHTYQLPGIYTVKLVRTVEGKVSDVTSTTVTVK